MPPIPPWAKDQRQKGTEIKVIGGRYYLCKVTSKWDPTLKRARKVSGEYLGVLTPDGLIPVHRKMLKTDEPVLSKEYGASWLLASLTGDIKEHLQYRFPDIWKELYVMCLVRTVRPCALRYISQRYETSILSEAFPDLSLSGASITTLLKSLGTRREAISSFMKDFLQNDQEYLLCDGTGIVSFSQGMDDTQIGYNSNHIYDPQVNLLYAFFSGHTTGMPAYYRKFPGSIRDVNAFKVLVTEMGMKDIVVIADKGFGSAANFTDLDSAGLQYIIPLHRNSLAYDRIPLMRSDKSGFEGVFQFNDRPIWYYRCTDHDGHALAVFQDGELRLKEEKDYLRRLFKRHEGYSEEKLRRKELEFGTIVLKTNLAENPDRLYHLYKRGHRSSRCLMIIKT